MKIILGGARSGKSSRAAEIAKDFPEVIYLATGRAVDKEMESRINRHQMERPSEWETWEEPINIIQALHRFRERSFKGVVLLDCVGFWVSNMLEEYKEFDEDDREGVLLNKVEETIEIMEKSTYHMVAVSNLVGMGLVPANKVGREFRDILGLANQRLVEAAGEVTLMVAGLPVPLKKEGESIFEKG